MNARDLAVKLTSCASYIASREWAREHSVLPVLICVAPDIARGAAHATGGSGQTSGNLWIGGVDNHRSAVGRTWVNRANLVAGYAPTQSNGTARQFAQTMRLRQSG